MRFTVAINGRTRSVSVQEAGGRFAVEVDGRARTVDLAAIDGSTWSLLLQDDDRSSSYEVGVTEERSGDLAVHVLGAVIATRLDEGGNRHGGRRDGSDHRAAPGVQSIVAPMPGKVVRVLVAPGDRVAARQGLVVVEAMKMENELRSPKDGLVTAVSAIEGLSVEAGTVLVVVE